MKYLANFFFIIPILFLGAEIVYFSSITPRQQINPYSNNNRYLSELMTALQLSGLEYHQLNLFDHRQEVELVISDRKNHSFKTVLSTKKTSLSQVAALQKLIKIANIEGRGLSFVDLSSRRPYATF